MAVRRVAIVIDAADAADAGTSWVVMADPEDHQFCLVRDT